MTPDECNDALKENLSESLRHASDLRSLLSDEREALSQTDPDALSDTAVQKRICIEKLEALQQSRVEMSAACGYGRQPADIAELVRHCDRDDVLSRSWTQFLDIARECSDMNSSNGAIIRVRQAQIKSAISLLRDGSTDADTYGPNGRDGDDSRSRSLAEA